MKMLSWVLQSPILFRSAGWFARLALRVSPRWLVYNRFNTWDANATFHLRHLNRFERSGVVVPNRIHATEKLHE